MPPMLCFGWADKKGFFTVDRKTHYGARAAGGCGLIIIEASGVVPDGGIIDTAPGIWSDEHIPQFREVAEVCQSEGALVLLQLIEAGIRKNCNELNSQDKKRIRDGFIQAALRAQEAGLDGVEIHGAHGYLLNQFLSPSFNRKQTSFEERCVFPLEVLKGIREAVKPGFIISYRLGCCDLTLEEDKKWARILEENGADLLNVSSGIGVEELSPPEDFPFSATTWMGCALSPCVDIPVACVNNILHPREADFLIKKGYADLVAVGRGVLADAGWVNKGLRGEEVNLCRSCKKCLYVSDGRRCPQYNVFI